MESMCLELKQRPPIMKEIIILLVVAVLLFISSGLGVAYMVYTPIKNCKTEAAKPAQECSKRIYGP